ncbi:hypothetical protein P175DRAFT_0507918 [Aspergillus ochraceoroseus IBT 24754]|uniref:Transcription activator of gluconeogenesis acuK n=1 Tax=Aspergillus ochraceoroseus IBT 24754 TaxID=1392256 RepID=A0A2T5M3T1_9EURO|nr:uncharacterized protein P175DRAFT_0507918 [Aspergillus ochraceoroseus IBT 24754]PTU23190.1 hypothetical protein P175DRAFT_0507918 [Aspergillus ochraceoroseus IBT 24754]
MQSLVLPPSFVASEFGHPRFASAPERLPLNLPRSTNARRCTPRDLPLPRSMSSSVPAEDPLEISGNARRPGHPDVPQPVTAVTTTAGAAAASTGVSGPVLPPGSPDPAAVHEAVLQQLVSAPRDETFRQSFAISEPFPSSRLPSSLTGPGSTQSVTATYHQPTFGGSPPGQASRALPQKPTRRTKAHVASACVNCKKKHLGCDPARPCRRCVLSGKEATCVDVTHKRRGRPPLKAEEASLRTYTAQMDNRGVPGEQGVQSRRSMHRATSSREIRPMTDLQMHPGQPGAMGIRMSAGHPQRWSTAVYPHAVDPALSMQRAMGHRRFSSSGSVQSLTAASPPSYVAVPGGYNPALAVVRMPTCVGGRPVSSYTNQGLHPAASPPQYHPTYGVPISPYPENPRMGNRMQMSEASMARDPRESYVESTVRLPPIYPPTMTNTQGHRLSDAYPTMWSPRMREEYLQQQQQQQQQQMSPHDIARQQIQPGLIEPISPTHQMHQTVSDFGYMDPTPRQMGPGVVSPTQGLSRQMPATRPPDTQTESETDNGDSSRPAKRRKMALDDMVND